MAGDGVRGIACEGEGRRSTVSVVDVGSVGDSRLVCVRKRRSGGQARCCRRPVGCFRCQAFLRCVRALAVELLGDSIRPRRRPAKLHPALTLLGIAPRLRLTTNCSSSRLFLYQREQCLEMLTHSSYCHELVRAATHTCIVQCLRHMSRLESRPSIKMWLLPISIQINPR